MAARLRTDEQGFGLIELLIAMMVLSIGVFAVAAAFTSGTVALRRADQIATASAIADTQMELYRASRHDAIALDVATVPPAGDLYWTGFGGTLVTASACPATATEHSCDATRIVAAADSPDGREYRVDTYIVSHTPYASTTGGSRAVKAVTVVVRDARTSRALVRQQSTFDLSTGR
jgi:prepilin-type N-terminal cleavage/methylation domain-containing protein